MAATRFTVGAPGKLNLSLFVGAPRPDGLHELVSVFQPVSLADQIDVRFEYADGPDQIVCSVMGDQPNIVGTAVKLCRERGMLQGVRVDVAVQKRVPIAAGMGGGSGDAAAFLRAACAFEECEIGELADLAFSLGADVPSQLTPVATIVRGAGEIVEPLPVPLSPPPFFVIVPSAVGLSTAEVFRKADELGNWHDLERSEQLTRNAVKNGTLNELFAISQNGLQPAILELRPELGAIVESLRAHGADWAGFTGSGPTAFGVYFDAAAAHAAASTLSSGHPNVAFAMPVEPQDWQVMAHLEDGR